MSKQFEQFHQHMLAEGYQHAEKKVEAGTLDEVLQIGQAYLQQRIDQAAAQGKILTGSVTTVGPCDVVIVLDHQ